MKLPKLTIKNFSLDTCIIQGGMGVGVSLHQLAGAVSREGGLGTISSAGLRTIVSIRDKKVVDTREAVGIEIKKAQELSHGRPIAINVMCALRADYETTIRAAIDAKVSAIICGAGMPTDLPGIQNPGDTALIPIVSSARALEIILGRWKKFHYLPDAVIVEGPKAGGHLGFKMDEIDNPDFALEKILPPVLEVARKNGNIPVIPAGGIYNHQGGVKFLTMGASGFQMGTRFLATNESAATDFYKQAVISAGVDDIMVVGPPSVFPASPCGLPFRLLKTSPMYKNGHEIKCDKRYVLQRGPDGNFSTCQAMPGSANCKSFLCICNGLLASAGYAPGEPPLYTVGTNAYRINKILPVADLMHELCHE
ncbi:MAG: nitronate monooxygenase [Minisyncoccia bacterium]